MVIQAAHQGSSLKQEPKYSVSNIMCDNMLCRLSLRTFDWWTVVGRTSCRSVDSEALNVWDTVTNFGVDKCSWIHKHIIAYITMHKWTNKTQEYVHPLAETAIDLPTWIFLKISENAKELPINRQTLCWGKWWRCFARPGPRGFAKASAGNCKWSCQPKISKQPAFWSMYLVGTFTY